MRLTVLVGIVGLALAATVSVAAHHSYSAYDQTRYVTVEGQLERVVFANPHVVLFVTTTERQTYEAEWASINQLAKGGVTATSLKAGDRVVITGRPLQNPTERKLSLLSQVHHVADGWTWKRNAPPPTAGQ
jgi:Family of unknown function (DUF6152)